MDKIIRQGERALLFDSERRLVFSKRTKPEQDPCRVTVGGGLEPRGTGAEAAPHREFSEELGVEVDEVRQVFLITDDVRERVGLQHVFVARLASMNPSRRTGTELADPGRGTYEAATVPTTREGPAGVRLLPFEPVEFTHVNLNGLQALAEITRTRAPLTGEPLWKR